MKRNEHSKMASLHISQNALVLSWLNLPSSDSGLGVWKYPGDSGSHRVWFLVRCSGMDRGSQDGGSRSSDRDRWSESDAKVHEVYASAYKGKIPRMQQDTTSSSSFSSGAKKIVYKTPYAAVFFHSGDSPATFSSVPVGISGVKSLSQMMSEHQEQLNRLALGLSNLQKTFKEAENLRQENTNLRVENNDLSNQLDFLFLRRQSHGRHTIPFYDPLPLSSSVHGGMSKRRESGEGFGSGSPTSVIGNDRVGGLNSEAGRVTLPKSISVRSSEFWKMSQGIGMQFGPTASISDQVRGETWIRAPTPASGPQRVYVRGESCKKKGPIEMEVYNQGTYKTELCNKWQESGTCPYGDNCQFAHGIGEIRPVIRHPRYKTEVCQMILSGGPCPYGHRCHFRHALTDQEKLVFPLNLH